jgi:DNA-binding IclR family transcriptional regulator
MRHQVNMDNDEPKTLQRMVEILDCFSYDRPELGVREIARKIGYSSSTTGRLLQAMKELHILCSKTHQPCYSLGGKVLAWAGVYSASLDVRNAALPYIQELHRVTHETISLYVLEGTERVCVERLESPQNVRIIARLGRRRTPLRRICGQGFFGFGIT